ncbi:MAG: AAA family ATPase [Ignavibacteria bacterium]|nr:AAA family ATPase [Ignavibacteria bacterium]
MKLKELVVKNYKSLKDITFRPSDFSVIIGPNASGKSNFANAISFLSEVYSYGLETAIRRKGGYENIVLKKIQKTKLPLEFSIALLVREDEFEKFLSFGDVSISIQMKGKSENYFLVKHTFSLKIKQKEKKSNFVVNKELLEIYDYKDKVEKLILRISRNSINEITYEKYGNLKVLGNFENVTSVMDKDKNNKLIIPVKSQELVVNSFFLKSITTLPNHVAKWAIYQFSSSKARLSGVPTPNPEISEYGDNLPALVDWLKTNHLEAWKKIFNAMKLLIPGLNEITTGYLHNKTLGLFFHEEKFGNPWISDEVSDGTILVLSILCSIWDPRKSLILIEEPENSLHPYILRELIRNFKEISLTKTIIITTHSPILLDMVHPTEIWCISKVKQISILTRLVDLAKELEAQWLEGEYRISEYLDSNLIPSINPGGIN